MKTVLKNCRVLGTTHDKDMLHDIYVENGIIEKIGLNLEVEGAKQIDVGRTYGDVRIVEHALQHLRPRT